AIGTVIALFEVQSRRETEPFTAKVIGFSTGRNNKPDSPSFHSVAQYVGPDGRIYYIEGPVGSSVPLHAVGDSVTVLVNPLQPDKALLKTKLSFVIGIILAIMGLVFVGVFRLTFHASLYSVAMAAVVVVGVVLQVKKAWRKQPLSLEAW